MFRSDRAPSVEMGVKNWFVAKTRPAREHVALINLKNQSIEAFLPFRRSTRRGKGRMVATSTPLFPGYIFVALPDDAAVIRSVNGTLGIAYLITANEKPSPLPRGFVETMLAATGPDGVVSHGLALKPGDRVEFCQGAFARQFGRILSMDDKGRVAVLMDLLSMRVQVRASVELLLPA